MVLRYMTKRFVGNIIRTYGRKKRKINRLKKKKHTHTQKQK